MKDGAFAVVFIHYPGTDTEYWSSNLPIMRIATTRPADSFPRSARLSHWPVAAIVAILHLLAFLTLNHHPAMRLPAPAPYLRLTVVEPVSRSAPPAMRSIVPPLARPGAPVAIPALPAVIEKMRVIGPAPIIAPIGLPRPLDLQDLPFHLSPSDVLPGKDDRLRLLGDRLDQENRLGNLARPEITSDDCTVVDQRDLDANAAVSADPTGSHHSLPGQACRAHQTTDALKDANNRLTPR